MKAVLLLALIAAAGFALARASGGPELRAMDAPARSIEGREGALLAALEFGEPARLLLVRPGTLRPVARPIWLEEEFVTALALSPDGRRLALGSETHSRIELVDLRRWRSLGTIDLPGPRPAGYGGAVGLSWPGPRRLVVLSGAPYLRASPMVVDPVARRVVRRSGWRGPPLQWDAHGRRLVVLAAARRGPGPGPATLIAYDAAGRLRELRLGRILAGSGGRGPGPARDLTPALAVDWKAGRAYVVSTDGVVAAEVDLRSWRLDYHELGEPRTALGRLRDLIEPPAHAKGEPVEARTRVAEVLPNGAIAVSGEDHPATEPPHASRPVPYGLRLIDPRTWTIATVDPDCQEFTVAGGLILARRWSVRGEGLQGIGVRAYDTAGEPRYARFEGADTIVRGAAGRLAYVEVRRAGRRRMHVLELESGRTVRTLAWREIRLLRP